MSDEQDRWARRWPPRRGARRGRAPAPAQLYLDQPRFPPGRSRAATRWSACPCRGATPAEYRAHLLWNLRAGLNVAALQCQFSPYLRTVANYNAILAHHSRELAAAYTDARRLFPPDQRPHRPAPVRPIFDPDLQQFLDAAGPARLLPDRGADRQGGAGHAARASSASSPARGCASSGAACARPMTATPSPARRSG